MNHGNNITDHPDTFAPYRHRHTALDGATILGGLGFVLVIFIVLLLMGKI